MKPWIAIGMTCAVLLTGCTGSAPVPAETPEAESAMAAYFLAGKIQAAEAADLAVPYAGRVTAVPAAVGDTVLAGDPLVILDSSEAEAQVAASKGAYETALANLEKARTGARPEQLRQAEALLESARVAKENADAGLKRQQELMKAGAASQAALETAQGQAAAAEAAYRSAEEQLTILKNGETQAYLAVLEKQVQQAEAAMKVMVAALENRTVKAPFDGVVVACPARPGESYAAQTVLVTLENRERLTVDAYGPVSAAQRFQSGETVRVRVAEYPEMSFDGTVTWVGDTVDSKRRDVLVKVSLTPAEQLMAGMIAEIAPGR